MTSPALTPIRSNGQADCLSDLPDPALVRAELQRILESPVFRNSKRYAAVLRYIVEQTLSGSAEHLKERIIGVDVFGRAPNYDTACDHVVRSAMAEVRKRLSQYYAARGEADVLHFELQPGSYVPAFRWEREREDVELAPPEIPATIPRVAPLESIKPRISWTAVLLVLLSLTLGVFIVMRVFGGKIDAIDGFWGPVLAAPGDAFLCIGNLEGGNAAPSPPSSTDLRLLSMGDLHHLPSQHVHVMDAIAMAKFASFLQARNKHWHIADQTGATYSDLRNGPAILIGLMNNDWTERLVGQLRYRAERIGPRRVAIRDSRNPGNNSWSMDYGTPLLNITRDYALVLRVFDPNTDQTVITAAGISVFGTLAAAEFLTDEHYLRELNAASPGWEKKNVEVVLSTEVVRAKSGRPRIVAAHAW